MGNNNGVFRYSKAHSNSTVRWPFKTVILLSTISSSTIRRRRITTFNAIFQGFISVWRKIHISVTRVTLPYQLMFEIIPWENKLDNIFFYCNIANKGINDRYLSSYTCIDYKFSLPDASDHCSQNGRICISLTHCIKLTKITKINFEVV